MRTAVLAVPVLVLGLAGAAPAAAAPPAPPAEPTSFVVDACGGSVQITELVNKERSRDRDGVTYTQGRYVVSVARLSDTGTPGPAVTFNASGPTVISDTGFLGRGLTIGISADGTGLALTAGPVTSDATGTTLPHRVVDVCALI